MMKRLKVVAVVLCVLAGQYAIAQTSNTLYARQFPGNTVGAKVTAAQAACSADTAVPCVIILDPVLAVYSTGTMPNRSAHMCWWDYRTTGSIKFGCGVGNTTTAIGAGGGGGGTVGGTGTAGKITKWAVGGANIEDSGCSESGGVISCTGVPQISGAPGAEPACPADGTGHFVLSSTGNRPRYCFNGGGYSNALLASERGAANGVASLDSGTKVPVAQLPVFVASGASSAAGIVPDPGVSAGTTKFLREDATWQVPAGGGGSGSLSTAVLYLSNHATASTAACGLQVLRSFSVGTNTLVVGQTIRIQATGNMTPTTTGGPGSGVAGLAIDGVSVLGLVAGSIANAVTRQYEYVIVLTVESLGATGKLAATTYTDTSGSGAAGVGVVVSQAQITVDTTGSRTFGLYVNVTSDDTCSGDVTSAVAVGSGGDGSTASVYLYASGGLSQSLAAATTYYLRVAGSGNPGTSFVSNQVIPNSVSGTLAAMYCTASLTAGTGNAGDTFTLKLDYDSAGDRSFATTALSATSSSLSSSSNFITASATGGATSIEAGKQFRLALVTPASWLGSAPTLQSVACIGKVTGAN